MNSVQFNYYCSHLNVLQKQLFEPRHYYSAPSSLDMIILSSLPATLSSALLSVLFYFTLSLHSTVRLYSTSVWYRGTKQFSSSHMQLSCHFCWSCACTDKIQHKHISFESRLLTEQGEGDWLGDNAECTRRVRFSFNGLLLLLLKSLFLLSYRPDIKLMLVTSVKTTSLLLFVVVAIIIIVIITGQMQQ